jgi:hypothetical protein
MPQHMFLHNSVLVLVHTNKTELYREAKTACVSSVAPMVEQSRVFNHFQSCVCFMRVSVMDEELLI